MTALTGAFDGRLAYDNRLLHDSFRQTVPLRHDGGWLDQATGLAPIVASTVILAPATGDPAQPGARAWCPAIRPRRALRLDAGGTPTGNGLPPRPFRVYIP